MIISVFSLYDVRIWEASVPPLEDPPLVSSLVNHFDALVSVLYTQDVGYSDTIIIYWFYTRLTCVHVEPAQPTPSTAPPLPCETHPAQRLFITLVGNPTEREPHHYNCGKY